MYIGIRGGLTQASLRYAKANNHTVHDYDSSKTNTWITYLDCKLSIKLKIS